MLSLALILLQTVLVVVSLRLLIGSILPSLRRMRCSDIVLDIWLPISLALPMLVMVGRMHEDAQGVGWVPLGGPLVCGAFGLGMMLLFGQPGQDNSGLTLKPMAIWMTTGLVMLFLGVAHELRVWTGQVMFALGAVLMWLNATHSSELPAKANADEMNVGYATFWVVLCSLGQGLAAVFCDQAWWPLSSAMMIAYAVMVLAATARLCGPQSALRLGGWTATYGVMFGLGLASLLFMLPTMLEVWAGESPNISDRVAHGFGRYALEGSLLLILGPVGWLTMRLHVTTRRVCGILALLATSTLAAWRLASM
ncbi:MAG: hypothetical protein IIB54_03875 [Planctomycetes bacterium]|nr:hypothetical protein [Planctomycetota bacterium]